MSAPWRCPNVDCSHTLRTGAPAELAADVDVCPHCGAAGDAFVPMVTVASFPEPYLAHLVRSRLEADGIVATLSDEHLASMTHIGSDGGVKLQIRRDQVEAAMAIMQGVSGDAVSYDDDESVASEPRDAGGATVRVRLQEDAVPAMTTIELACPRCGASVSSTRPPARFLPRFFGASRTCGRCGHVWRA